MKARVIRRLQLILLRVSFALASLRPGRVVDWVVGPFEVAGVVRDIGAVVPRSRTVLLARHAMYGDNYDWLPREREPKSAVIRRFIRDVRGPMLLGRLAARTRGFIYVSAEGFLPAYADQREAEFRFLRSKGKKIVCYFTGSDIRAPRLMEELERDLGEPNLGTWLRTVVPGWASAAHDDEKRRVGAVASEYADAIYTAEVDQRGYFSVPTRPFSYFFPSSAVTDDFAKFEHPERLVVLHAPTSPVIKGTQLVRAAVAALREEGYDFEYVELQNVTNDVVRKELARSHIVLNQFFAYVPGVFAIEAMAACCAVLHRADEEIETQLPPGSNDAWFVTRHYQVTEHLRMLLDDPALAARYARAGREWVVAHATSDATGPKLREQLDELLAPTSS